jgi:multicomponent K+:H+ antiporter subunit E
MKRVPWLLILGLTGMWLLLQQGLSFGQLLLGLVLATLMTLGFARVRPVHPRLRRPLAALRLLGRVVVDILRSNLAVARIVLGLTGQHGWHSGFVEVPLTVRDPHALATLAAIMTATPGTVWADLSPDNSVLTIHVLDLRDPEGMRDIIRNRYESLLQEIFE